MPTPRIARYAAALALGCSLTASAATASLTAAVTGGRIEGVRRADTVAFLGVPFAAPPVGAARWRPPAAVVPWSGVRKAAEFAPSCPQVINPPEGRAPWTPEYLIPGATAEDCLYLNVWRPTNPQSKRLPILVWIHGGALVEGSGSVPVYDGAALASHGIIVVTINYRLGVLGFLAHPALSREQGGTSGNYGLQDVLAALHWVQNNAAAFGGDPARVTIAGQSAGSTTVNALTGTPVAKGLFARTITESGSGWGQSPGSLSVAEAQGQAFAQQIGADSLDALRGLPADALIKQVADHHVHFGMVLDGQVLPTDPTRAQATHDFNDTPVLSGFNADEDSGYDARYGQWTVAELNHKRDALFGPVADHAAEFYSAASDTDAQGVGRQMMRDHSRAYAYEWARRRARASRNPIYLYYYEHPEPGPTQARYGTFHTDEVPYVFGNLNAPRPFTDADRRVSSHMMARWLAFIEGGSPNAPGLAQWRAFDADQPTIMHLGDNAGEEPLLSADKLLLNDDYIDRVGFSSPHGAD